MNTKNPDLMILTAPSRFSLRSQRRKSRRSNSPPKPEIRLSGCSFHGGCNPGPAAGYQAGRGHRRSARFEMDSSQTRIAIFSSLIASTSEAPKPDKPGISRHSATHSPSSFDQKILYE